jgi:hypothetical protein
MTQAWITTSSTNVEAFINQLNAACNAGFVPGDPNLLENPGVTEEIDQALEMIDVVIDA